MDNIPLPLGAFLAGIVSFLSPCVLPLVPGYVSVISGSTIEEMERDSSHKLLGGILLKSVMFILGFTVVFISLGAAATEVGHLTHRFRDWLNVIAGVVIIVFGVHLTGLYQIRFLFADTRMHSLKGGSSIWGAFVVGFSFAFGWTPCIGPILAVILKFAYDQSTVWKGIWLLAIYSAGLAVPFLITSFGIERFLRFSDKFKRHLHTMEVVSGWLLIVIGLLIILGKFTWLSSQLGFLNRFAL